MKIKSIVVTYEKEKKEIDRSIKKNIRHMVVRHLQYERKISNKVLSSYLGSKYVITWLRVDTSLRPRRFRKVSMMIATLDAQHSSHPLYPLFLDSAPLEGMQDKDDTQDNRKMGCFGSKDKLSKEDMDFLKSHTRYDEATIKEWYKGFKQDCPNGRLTPAKFVDMYKMFFPSGNAEEFCDHVFRTFDMDKNGYIDFKEFLLAIDVTSSGTPEEKLKWAFRMYDVDGNGVIDIQEMTKIVQAIYDMLGACSSNRPADSAEERAKNIFARMDENNDELARKFGKRMLHKNNFYEIELTFTLLRTKLV
ncbi:Neuronal calcium sensor [Apis cerana cerana]|uniref:Neuronal calcium sensor n=1 Tax=Apis cerana cerana TaxID=94128 RepID=A0A2A3E7I6_APICC|nr:Neuronal calcium sensor [Apis cerana cerana]